jgi:hypothetical protein
MEDRKELGKIQAFDVGIGGYQDVMLGVTITLGGKGWGVCDHKGTWSPSHVEWSKMTKWSEDDRDKSFSEVMRFIDQTLSEAKKKRTQDLIGVPIEATFKDYNTLKSWRILTEVL